jgi:hypothetical protein
MQVFCDGNKGPQLGKAGLALRYTLITDNRLRSTSPTPAISSINTRCGRVDPIYPVGNPHK